MGKAETCWFDYIGMSDEERCAHFAEAYSNAYRLQYAKRMDWYKAIWITPIPGMRHGDVATLSAKQRGHLKRSVRAADALGVPYDFYCATVIAWRSESLWTYLPHLHSMYDDDLPEYVQRHWERHVANHVVLPNPRFVEKYGMAFVNYLYKIAHARRHPKYIVREFLDQGYLAPEAAEQLFGNDLTTQALRIAV